MTKNSKHLSLHEATDKIVAVLNEEKDGRQARTSATPQSGASGRDASEKGVGRWLAVRRPMLP